MKTLIGAIALSVAAPLAVAQTTEYTITDTIFTGGTASISSSGLCKVATQKVSDAELVRLKESPSNRDFLAIIYNQNSTKYIMAFFDISQGEHLAREFTSQVSGTPKKATGKGIQTEHLILAPETLKLLSQRNEHCFAEYGLNNTYLFTDGEPNSTLTINTKYKNGVDMGGTVKQVIKAEASHFDYGKKILTNKKESDLKLKTTIKVSFTASAPLVE